MIMERGFYNEDFEQLIKQKADQYKMYPSDKVWKGIYRDLHTRRKWYWLGFVLFLTGICYYAIVELISPSTSNKVIVDNNVASTATPPSRTDGKSIIAPFTTIT